MTGRTDPWTICPACRGDGNHVNPAIDCQGLTAEDFRDDPDFADDYFSGVHNVTCRHCSGSGKVRQSKVREMEASAAARRLAAMEDGDVEGYYGAGDVRW